MSTEDIDHEAAFAPVIHHDPEPAEVQVGKPPAFVRDAGKGDEEAEERKRQEGFDAEFEWNGKPLHGFSSSREALFGQLRMSMGAPPLDLCIQDADAFLGDAHRILWLCSHEPKEWAILRTSPGALQAAIDTWADEHAPKRVSLLASTFAMKIYYNAGVNQHEAAPVRKAHGDDVGN